MLKGNTPVRTDSVRSHPVRRLIAAVSSVALVAGLTLLLVAPAQADITAPGNNAVLRGNATISASGASDGTACVNASGPQTQLQLVNTGGSAVFDSTQGGTGAKSVVVDTHGYPNGSYTARAIERNRSGFLYCSNNTKTTNRSVTIDNITQLAYSGASDGAQNTSVTVRATLTDPNLAASVLPGRVVTFALAGDTPITATTNSNGVATATLPVSGPPRTTTVTASFPATSFYKGSSASTPFVVEKNASTTTLVPPAAAVHGESVSFTAQIDRVDGTSTPGGTVQFTVDGADFGPPATVAGGVATSPSTDDLSTGNHTIGARYSGDANLLTSTAATKTQSIGKAATTTSLTSTGSPTRFGEAVTFTATVDVVAPGVGDPAGGVQFNIDGAPYGTAVALTGNEATLTVSNLPAGNHTVGATYNGNGDFATSSSAELTHGVERADTTTTLSTSNADAVAGEPLTYTAEIDVVAPGAGNPSGTVQFASDGEPIGGPVTVSNGSAVSTPVGLDAGDHVITADYSGDTRFAGGSATIEQEVAAAQTTTVVSTSPNPSVVGQEITISATVTPNGAATGTPGGFVQFLVDGVSLGFVALEGGTASIPVSDLTWGSHDIKATYLSADPNFVTSTSTVQTHTVNKAATKTVLTTSSPVAVWGQPVTFTAEVSVVAPGAGSPSGTVTFLDGSAVLGTVDVSSATGGIATITVDDLAVGQHAVEATYDGNDSFQGSTASIAQKVQRAQTSTVLESSANPAVSGEGITFTTTVSPVAPGAGEPTGTVTFTVNGANLGAPVAVVDGVATSPAFASAAPGIYRIAATYSGDSHFIGGTGLLDQGNGQQVGQGSTVLGLVSDDELSTHGQTVTLTATVQGVAPATGKPTGVVRFWDGQSLIGAVNLSPTGVNRTSVATFSVSTLSPGQHAIRAVYDGNFNYSGSEHTITQVVGTSTTVTGLSSTANPATYGDSVTLVATVAELSGSGAPTGSVTFHSGEDVLGTVPLSTVAGVQHASLVVEGLAAGSHEVTATYSGDASRAPSTSPVLVQVVQRAASKLVGLSVQRSNNNAVQEVRARLTTTDGTPIAGQSIVFSTVSTTALGYRLVCEAVTGTDGVAQCRIPTNLPAYVRNDGFDATFAGNASYLPTTEHGSGT